MKSNAIIAAVAMAICVVPAGAQAAPVVHLIPVTGAQDMVFDAPREVIYITAGTQVLRYDVATCKFLSPITLGGSNLHGIDLSPDGTTLMVADTTPITVTTGGAFPLHFFSLPWLVDHEEAYALPAPGGSWAVSYAANGNWVVTAMLTSGSQTLPTWYHSVSPNNTYSLASLQDHSMVTASGDGSQFDFAETADAGSHAGLWDTYNISANSFATNPAGTPLRDVASNADGQQVTVIPSNNNAIVYTNGTNSGGSIVALDGVYDPVRPIAYFSQPNSSFVIAYNMSTLAQTAVYDFDTTFQGGSWAFGGGRMRISADGSHLMAIGNDGVRYVQLYAPLKAANVAATTPAGHSVNLTAAGSIGISATLTYVLPTLGYQQPAHGTASVNGNVVTYVPDSGFSGTDTFTYQVRYGRAFEDATMTVTVQ